MTTRTTTWAAIASMALVACVALGCRSTSTAADPVSPTLALFVDVASTRLPDDVLGNGQKRFDLQGFPLLISRGATTNLGVAADTRLEFDPHLSIDSHGSISRVRVGSLVGLDQPGAQRGNGQATLRYSYDWFDVTVTPGATAVGPERGMALAYSLDSRTTLHAPFGWELTTGSRFAHRNAVMDDGSSGRDGSFDLDATRRLASGSSIGAGYSYGWSSPESAAVSFEQEVAVSAEFAFISDLNCRAAYRQGLAVDAPQSLALGMDWDLHSGGFGATSLKADLNIQRHDPEADPGTLAGTANLGLAMKF